MRAARTWPFASASSSGTLAPVPKNISSGVCAPNAGCGIFVLCSLTWNATIGAEAAPSPGGNGGTWDLNVPGNGHGATTNDVFAKAMVVGASCPRRVRDGGCHPRRITCTSVSASQVPVLLGLSLEITREHNGGTPIVLLYLSLPDLESGLNSAELPAQLPVRLAELADSPSRRGWPRDP